MHIDIVPNRNSKPAVLLRETFREGNKVHKRTLANLSMLPPEVVAGLRVLLKGGTAIEDLSDAFEILRSAPYGHIQAALGTARKLQLETVLDPKPSPERDLALAMILARLLDPASKLATARGLGQDAQLAALQEELKLPQLSADRLYAALDWLYLQQPKIEQRLAERHLDHGSLVLYDVTSTYLEGRCCPLAARGHSRDGKKNKLQIVFGLLCNREGCPIAVEVFAGNTADPRTLAPQIEKVRQRFGIEQVVLVGDRGLLTSARIREELAPVEGMGWITALTTQQLRQLEALPGLQLSLLDHRGFVQVTDPAFPEEALIVCRNPLLADERARKREELLQATERELDQVVAATQRSSRPLRGQDKIGLRVGKVLHRFKVAKHFLLDITDTRFTYQRNAERIAAEAALDGIYVIRTNVAPSKLNDEEAVRSYKGLAVVERAFRSIKTLDLKVRPIYHYQAERVRAHVFLCMLAYYLEWHLRAKLAPLLFEDDDKAAAEQRRSSIVAPAQVSASAQAKARTLRTAQGLPVNSFQTLMKVLATRTKNQLQARSAPGVTFDKLSQPTEIQAKAFALLGLPA